ncbi:MAG: hypothetical protein IPM66_16030 [Acidobacteriota bacterium]|nr:MAG: hypothetical protein IPM66_16030 [Acidobacteriota bacterium]
MIAFSAVALVSGYSQSDSSIEIRTLSSRPDLVSGGDVLIEIRSRTNSLPDRIALELNGREISRQLSRDPRTGSFVGLISGLKVGENILRAADKSTRAQATLKIINHPITGPILSGPHLKPYECRTVESGMGEPLDSDCSARQRIDYFYRASDKTFKPLADPFGPRPADLVNTTTYDGATVPYIVRVDSGTINRTIYRIAILDNPNNTAGEWRPGAGWNRKLAVAFGGGAGTQYNQGVNQATNALNDLYLSRGFAFAISTELVNQLHGNAVLQGETLMMLKEYFIERYGVPKWTVGHGGSGGAIQQLVITQLYPGLLDGLQPTASFPDSSLHTADCGLLQKFWRKADPAVWTDAKKTAVEGYTKGTCAAWERSFVPVLTATNARGCAMKDASKIYHPVSNPKGARCTMQEMRANIYGRDPKSGFARKPQDNIGLQYGLGALNRKMISVDEFLELNEKIGGNDIDGNFVAGRSKGDPIAIRALHESGLMNSGGGGLANVPIIHARSYTDAAGDIHDRQRDFTIRARLQRANGRHDNQVIWVGPPRRRGQPGSVDLAALSIDTLNKWLDAISADPAPLSTDKVVRHKPAEAVDACWDSNGWRIDEKASFDGSGKCETLYPVHSEPRLVAGAPLTNDVVKCRLKPIDFTEYEVTFTEEQKARMKAIFPSGVCDFSKPGISQGPIKDVYRKY